MINQDSDIFKYCSFEIGELIISSQLLKFSNPGDFNDPFDCDINLLKFDFKKSNKEVQKDINQLKENISKEYGRDMSAELDKLFEEKLEDIYKKSQIDKINRSSICCFSKVFDNTTMWSHYSDNHNGICLVFDIENKDPFVDYGFHKFTNGPVNYDDFEVMNYLENKKAGMINLFLSKSKDWKYEEEYRFVIFEESGLFKFNSSFLKGVIFGQRVKDDQIIRFKTICKKFGWSNLSFRKMIKNELELDYIEL